jgi:hypothetical protein
MKTAIAEALENLALGEPQVFHHLAMFPLVAMPEKKPDYVPLAEALASGRARITEVSEGGHVPELLFDNATDHRVLLLSGDELVGARQNRILNVTILVAPGAKLTIPVSCVERGRWSYRSREFRSEDRMMFARGRAEKMEQVARSRRVSGTRASDQGAIWSAVSEKAAAFCARTPTEAMSDVYAHVEGTVGEYRAAFEAVPGQVGAVFAIDGRMAGVELFDAAMTLRSSLRRLVGSYALDAIESRARPFPVPSAADARKFLDEAVAARMEESPAVGLGTEVRLAEPGIVGEGLVVDGRVVHLSALARGGGREPVARGNRARAGRGSEEDPS